MSYQRRNPTVDMLYSEWHRPAALDRYLSKRDSRSCAMIDIDALEYCDRCFAPLALIETKKWGASRTYTVTKNLASAAGIPAYLVEYRPVDGEAWHGQDIDRFRVQRDGRVKEFEPCEFAAFLLSLRSHHKCGA